MQYSSKLIEMYIYVNLYTDLWANNIDLVSKVVSFLG